jgi:hypothetical protein
MQSVVAELWQRWVAVLMLQSVVTVLWQRRVAVLWQRMTAEMLMLWKKVEWLFHSCQPRADWCRRSSDSSAAGTFCPCQLFLVNMRVYVHMYVEILFIMHALALKSIMYNLCTFFSSFIED